MPKDLKINLHHVEEARDCFFDCLVFLNKRFSVAELMLAMADATWMFHEQVNEKIEDLCNKSPKNDSAKC